MTNIYEGTLYLLQHAEGRTLEERLNAVEHGLWMLIHDIERVRSNASTAYSIALEARDGE